MPFHHTLVKTSLSNTAAASSCLLPFNILPCLLHNHLELKLEPGHYISQHIPWWLRLITALLFVSNIEQGLLQETTSCDFILQSWITKVINIIIWITVWITLVFLEYTQELCIFILEREKRVPYKATSLPLLGDK